jgi:hypothetical protein
VLPVTGRAAQIASLTTVTSSTRPRNRWCPATSRCAFCSPAPRPQVLIHGLATHPAGQVVLRPVPPVPRLRARTVRLAALAPHHVQRTPAEVTHLCHQAEQLSAPALQPREILTAGGLVAGHRARCPRWFLEGLWPGAVAGFRLRSCSLKVSGANEKGEPKGEPTSIGIRPRQATSSHSRGWQMPRQATSSHVQRP